MPPVERQREVDRVPTGEPRGPKRQAGEPDEQPRPRGRGNAGAGPAGENPLQAWTPRRHGHPSGETGMRVARETPARFQLGPFPRRCWHPPAHKDLCAGTIYPRGRRGTDASRGPAPKAQGQEPVEPAALGITPSFTASSSSSIHGVVVVVLDDDVYLGQEPAARSAGPRERGTTLRAPLSATKPGQLHCVPKWRHC